MPVADHPIHPSTQVPAGHLYTACMNKVRAEGYYVMNRIYREDGTFEYEQKFIRDTLTKECQYDMHKTDSRCEGCKFPKAKG